ncbi:MAG TPA: DUF3750 domain-containing protein [Kofleriaceae bacterium]|nr:DUF3750 domain-containing protein [Kofleriaceae bacterium]
MGRALLGVCLALVAGCQLFARPLRAPSNDQATVLLISGGLGRPIEKIARHPWFAVREAGATSWTIWEVGGGGESENPFDNSPYLEPVLHGVWRGAVAERAIACLAREAPPWKGALRYRAWPGPNSNTFGDVMLRRCGLHASLPATSIGKDYRGKVGVSKTSEGTGFQIETWILGLRLGLKEGIEVHVIGLAFGVDLWPPALIIPIGSGRLGFGDR